MNPDWDGVMKGKAREEKPPRPGVVPSSAGSSAVPCYGCTSLVRDPKCPAHGHGNYGDWPLTSPPPAVSGPPDAQVTRFEVVDHRLEAPEQGRAFVAYQVNVALSYQDAGRTLKIFVTDRVAAQASQEETHE